MNKFLKVHLWCQNLELLENSSSVYQIPTEKQMASANNIFFQKIFLPIVTQKHKQLLFQGRGRQQWHFKKKIDTGSKSFVLASQQKINCWLQLGNELSLVAFSCFLRNTMIRISTFCPKNIGPFSNTNVIQHVNR